MTNDELQEHIRAIEEAVWKGEVEETYLCKNGGLGRIKASTVVIGSGCRYRIKRAPREFEVYLDRDDNLISPSPAAGPAVRIIRVREVIE